MTGCLTLKYDDTAAVTLAQQGQATIRGSQDKVQAKLVGPRIVRYYVTEVDEPAAVVERQNEVMALAPGKRRVKAMAWLQLPRFGGFDLYQFETRLTFDAEEGRHYELRGRGDERQVYLGVFDLADGTLVSEEVRGIPALITSHRAQPVIFVP